MTEPISKQTRFIQIKICGHLSGQRARMFAGYEITLTPDGHTILAGAEIDQAALFGLLLRIRDAGLPLVSVNRIDQKKGEHPLCNQGDESENLKT